MTKTTGTKKEKRVCKAAESVAEVVKQTHLQVAHHFVSSIYLIERPDFLPVVNKVSNEYLNAQRKHKKMNDIYPVLMSSSYFGDLRISEFVEFIGATAWNILHDQGYAMHDKVMLFTEMWTQEHHKHSAMEQHVHNGGAQIVGFYFLEVPDDSSRVVFHDPRAGKVQIDLPEQNVEVATSASRMINFTPKPGMVMFANAWLPHSFTRHAANKPIKFVHFNLTVEQAPPSPPSTPAEVI